VRTGHRVRARYRAVGGLAHRPHCNGPRRPPADDDRIPCLDPRRRASQLLARCRFRLKAEVAPNLRRLPSSTEQSPASVIHGPYLGRIASVDSDQPDSGVPEVIGGWVGRRTRTPLQTALVTTEPTTPPVAGRPEPDRRDGNGRGCGSIHRWRVSVNARQQRHRDSRPNRCVHDFDSNDASASEPDLRLERPSTLRPVRVQRCHNILPRLRSMGRDADRISAAERPLLCPAVRSCYAASLPW
jgi:hypothetical protein